LQARPWLRHVDPPVELGALTGQDSRALAAFAHLLELYAVSDTAGRRSAVLAMHHTIHAMQADCRGIAKRTIPLALDWGDETDLWEKIDV
jgi:hypothetical protein